jgi:2-oxoglutarate ferredoxin oxidoreductase subunit beta
MSVGTRPDEKRKVGYPYEDLLRSDRLPHIWCPECGIGTSVNCFTAAMRHLALDPDQVAIVSGIGCSGRVAGYMKLDSFHTTHGRAIISIGGNHFIHAARRNVDLTVICVNNFNYAMTGGQVGPTTPLEAKCTTTPYGNFEQPFNLPGLAASCGAVYVARWTALHVRRLTKAFEEALTKRGFSFVEVISPCPTLYTRRNKLGTGLEIMREYARKSDIEHGADPRKVDIDFRGRITVGKFVDIERPTLEDTLDQHMKMALGDAYMKIDVTQTVRADRRALRDT